MFCHKYTTTNKTKWYDSIFGRGTKSDSGTPDRRFFLAAIIVFAAFALVASMLAIQSYTVTTVISKIPLSASKTGSNLTALLTNINQSNQTLFNTLLPVFGAWVGVVIAFYFGSKQAEIAQETLAKTISSDEEKLVALKVQALLDKYPETQHPITVKLTDQIKDILAAFSRYRTLTNVLVVDNDNKPLGLLYKSELFSVLGPLDETRQLKEKAQGEVLLKDKLEEINNHLLIQGRKWMLNGSDVPASPPTTEKPSTENPTTENITSTNFATVTPDDNLFRAKERMINISKQINDVRCVVIVDEASGKVRGIFGYDSILAFVKT